MATRFLVPGRFAGDPKEDDWWFLITEVVVRLPIDDAMKAIILEAKRRNITVRPELPEYRDELTKVLSAA